MSIDQNRDSSIRVEHVDKHEPRFTELERFVVTKLEPFPDGEVMDSFAQLPDDDYLKEEWVFRKRAYARGILTQEGVEWHPDTDFFQPREINEYAGDIKRIFAPAGKVIRDYTLKLLTGPFYRHFLGDGRYYFGLHQIRIICDEQHEGHPVPEGYHQDGFDVVAVHCFQRDNIIGGKSFLREGSTDGPCILENDLDPGVALLFNDHRLYHYATPITSRTPGLGFRDMCVLTFSLIP